MEQLPVIDFDLVTRSPEDDLVHDWRAERLHELGVDWSIADRYADDVDWREVDTLVARGCPADLAVHIVR